MSGSHLVGDRAETRRARWRTSLLVMVASLAVGVLVALVLTVADANRQRDRALEAQRHSYEVMILARSLFGTMGDAEATLGRYVISGDKEIGRLYYERWLRASKQLRRLDEVTRAYRGQQDLIASLDRAYRARGAELSMVALNTRYGKNNAALSRYYRARNSEARERMERDLEALIASERNLLSARTAQAASTVARSNQLARVLIAFGVLLLAGAVALGWLVIEALSAQAVARVEVDEERNRAQALEDAVSSVTRRLEEEARERAGAEAKLRQVQKMDAVGQLTGGIAHDFNNMLAVVIGGLELAKRAQAQGRGAETRRHLDSAIEGAGRAAALTRQLLSFSREDALRPEAIDAGALIAGMSDLLDRTLGDTITVVTRDEERGWRTWADRHQLENAILNLAVNARDSMEGRGTLTIETGGRTLAEGQVHGAAPGDYLTVAVTDTGGGMTPEVLERVFEPFFTTKPRGKGTGLGLSQIFGFVRQSGGEVAVRSAPGEGTTVTLYLPRHRGPVSVAASSTPAPDATAAAPVGLDVLVVEDDARVLAATMGALDELGHRAVACDDPLRAVRIAAAMPRVDLILSDVLMPGRTGPEIVSELLNHHPDAAVLFVTGFAGDASERVALGGHAVLRKPFTLAALERELGVAMAGARRPPHPVAMAG